MTFKLYTGSPQESQIYIQDQVCSGASTVTSNPSAVSKNLEQTHHKRGNLKEQYTFENMQNKITLTYC